MREEAAGEGHTLKNRSYRVWANCSMAGGVEKNGTRGLVSLLQTACFYLFMEISLGSRVPSHHRVLLPHLSGMERSMVSQSCLRRPWRTGELRRQDLTARR